MQHGLGHSLFSKSFIPACPTSPVPPSTHHPGVCSYLHWRKVIFLTQTCPKESIALVTLPQLQLNGCLWAPPCWQGAGQVPLTAPTSPILPTPAIPPRWKLSLAPWHPGNGFCTSRDSPAPKPLSAVVHKADPVTWSCLVPNFCPPAIPTCAVLVPRRRDNSLDQGRGCLTPLLYVRGQNSVL